MSDFNVIYNIIAQDKFSRVGNKFAQVAKNIQSKAASMGSMISTVREKFSRLSATVKKAGGDMRKFGKDMNTKASLPAAAFAGNSIRLFDKQAQAVAKVQTLITSTGGSAKLTFQQLSAEASRLQENTIFGDEEILNSVTAQLLTFSNIAGDNFMRTQQAVLDLSTVLDGDLQSASIQLGKALNDPVASLSALSRSGIQFEQSQKDVIKALTESGRLADAQSLILNEINRLYGGTAAAAAKAGAGGIKQLWNILGDLSETIGEQLVVILSPLVSLIKEMALKFNAAPPIVKKVVAVLLLVVTVLGPLIVAIGLVMQFLPVLIAGFAGLAVVVNTALLPILAIGAAFAAAYWIGGKIADFLSESPGLWMALGAAVDAFIHPIDTVVALFDKIMSYDFSGVLGDIKSFFGFGDQAANINATTSSQSKVDVNLNAPAGVVNSVKASSDKGTQLNVGTNMTATAM